MAEITSSKTFQMCFWAGLLIVLVAIASVWLHDRDEPHTPDEVASRLGADRQPSHESEPAPAPQAPAAAPAHAAPAVEVTARQLFDDYRANEVRADEKYRGRLLHVIGRVAKVAKDLMNEQPYVDLRTPDGITGVDAGFAITTGLSDLGPGEPIAMVCVGNGMTPTRSPRLDGCILDSGTPADPNSFIPDPPNLHITLDLAGKDETDGGQHAMTEAAVAVRNGCRDKEIKGDTLGDLWNTASLVVKRSEVGFVVTATFDDRRKALHRGRIPSIEIDAKVTHIRALNDAARELCNL